MAYSPLETPVVHALLKHGRKLEGNEYPLLYQQLREGEALFGLSTGEGNSRWCAQTRNQRTFDALPEQMTVNAFYAFSIIKAREFITVFEQEAPT